METVVYTGVRECIHFAQPYYVIAGDWVTTNRGNVGKGLCVEDYFLSDDNLCIEGLPAFLQLSLIISLSSCFIMSQC